MCVCVCRRSYLLFGFIYSFLKPNQFLLFFLPFLLQPLERRLSCVSFLFRFPQTSMGKRKHQTCFPDLCFSLQTVHNFLVLFLFLCFFLFGFLQLLFELFYFFFRLLGNELQFLQLKISTGKLSSVETHFKDATGVWQIHSSKTAGAPTLKHF